MERLKTRFLSKICSHLAVHWLTRMGVDLGNSSKGPKPVRSLDRQPSHPPLESPLWQQQLLPPPDPQPWSSGRQQEPPQRQEWLEELALPHQVPVSVNINLIGELSGQELNKIDILRVKTLQLYLFVSFRIYLFLSKQHRKCLIIWHKNVFKWSSLGHSGIKTRLYIKSFLLYIKNPMLQKRGKCKQIKYTSAYLCLKLMAESRGFVKKKGTDKYGLSAMFCFQVDPV